ncbi:MAG: threonine--tRNA ligase [Spirochaetia bacterium]|nr:threonine--tRNA ligase [Spirochaetia bacterium]
MKSIILPDKKEAVIKEKQTFYELIKENLPQLLKKTIAVKINDHYYDLNSQIETEGEISLIDFSDESGREIYWHSTAHLLAHAIKRIFTKAQLTFGPVVKSGPGFFYYDIYLEDKISEEDLPKIEKEMEKIKSEALEIKREVISRDNAIEKFKKMGEDFKVQTISEIPEKENISIYTQGEFSDLCRGPHVKSTNSLGFFKLTAISGAYWKGDPKNPMLQRIYGISFPSEKELKNHLKKIEEAKERDHRKLGKELDLFSFHDEGPGFPFYHPKGTILFNELTNYIRKECDKRGYLEIKTPLVLSDELWIRSGHYDNFKENMYFTQIDEREFSIKPMNCPGSNIIYKNHLRSYRDLPLRMAELGMVHRHELSGVLHGLFRARSFTQDDAHIYCTPEQLTEEITSAIDFTISVYQKFGFENVKIFIATKPQKALGSEKVWETATLALETSLKKLNLNYQIKEGEGAFYGPKIEFNIEDCLERNWQCGTIQVDFSMPERFELEYTAADGLKHRPVMIHRAILGSLERFMGILIEHYAGKLPLWLNPEQIRVLTISSEINDYGKEVAEKLQLNGFRVRLDDRNEKIGYKIREWNQIKSNYALILGHKEKDSATLSVRKRGEKESPDMTLESFIKDLKTELNL